MKKNNEAETICDILRHKERVKELLNYCIIDLLYRGENHDNSKMEELELPIFAEHNDKRFLYGSEEYYENLEKMKEALDHHYKENSHHPQFFKEGIDGMNLLDLFEMICDFKASAETNLKVNIEESLDISINRFKISPQLGKILKNTVDVLNNI